MKATNTPEPWHCYQKSGSPLHITDSLGKRLLTVADLTNAQETGANAGRVVACVNACAGLNPAAVPETVKVLAALQATTQALVVKAESQPFLNQMLAEKLPAGWQMLKKQNELARAALARAKEVA